MFSKIIQIIKDAYTPTWQLCRYCNHRINFGIPASTNASWCLDEQEWAHVECDQFPVCISEINPPTEEQVSGRLQFAMAMEDIQFRKDVKKLGESISRIGRLLGY